MDMKGKNIFGYVRPKNKIIIATRLVNKTRNGEISNILMKQAKVPTAIASMSTR